MTAVEHADYRSPSHHPLAPGADPNVIRKHLLEDDHEPFDKALAEAANQGDEATRACIERWRCFAMSQVDLAAFTRMVRRAAERNTGVPCAEDEPLRESRAKAGI